MFAGSDNSRRASASLGEFGTAKGMSGRAI